MHQSIGKYIMITGILLFIVGGVVYFSGARFRWFGHLPGDIRIVKENFRLVIPITTMIILSLIITLIINIIRKLF